MQEPARRCLTEGGAGVVLDPVRAGVIPLGQVQHTGLGGDLDSADTTPFTTL